MINILPIILSILLFGESQSIPSINDYVRAAGGMERWESMQNVVIKSETNYYTKMHSSNGAKLIPEKSTSRKVITSDGRYFSEITTLLEGKRKVVYNGIMMKEISPSGFVYEDSKEIIDQYKMREIHLGEPWIATHADEVKYLGEESDGKNEFLVFQVTRLSFDRKYYILRSTKMLFKVTLFDGKNQSFFDDYRDVDGYKIPFKITGYVNGIMEHETLVQEIKINAAIQESIFAKD